MMNAQRAIYFGGSKTKQVAMGKNNKQRTAKTNKPKLTTKEKKAAKKAKAAQAAITLPKKPA